MNKQYEFKPKFLLIILLVIYSCILSFKISLCVTFNIIEYQTIFYDGILGDVMRITIFLTCLACFKTKPENKDNKD